MGDDDRVMVIMETMTTTKNEENETMTADQRKKKLTEVAAKFLGLSVWFAGYAILYTVGTLRIYWNVNKVGAILCVVPSLLVSCLLLLWVHAYYTVKLIDSHFINSNLVVVVLLETDQTVRKELEGNVVLRFFCIFLCLGLQMIILGVKDIESWDDDDGDGYLRKQCLLFLSFICLLVSYVHFKWICLYMDTNLKPFEVIKQQQLQPAAAAIRSNSSSTTSTTTINTNQTQQKQQQLTGEDWEHERAELIDIIVCHIGGDAEKTFVSDE